MRSLARALGRRRRVPTPPRCGRDRDFLRCARRRADRGCHAGSCSWCAAHDGVSSCARTTTDEITMSTLKVYGIPQSRAARVLWMVEECGVPYELVTTHYAKEAKSDAYRSTLNPNGRVPTIDD